jgi:BirA family transcriptional regulator, biotin operon repressor / biotin---[acetyl-CoA-carboxylase] ligase
VPEDSLAPEQVEPLLSGRFGRPYLYAARCESTQTALDEQPEGAVAVCEEQTAGRGRLGRPWTAPPGKAVLCSIVLKPPADREPAQLSLVAGLAAAEVIERALDLSAQIKWPNDVMVNRRKVAGVIAEASGDGRVIVGIGVNVNQEPEELPADARVAAASLYTIEGIRRERAPLLADLIGTLERLYGLWSEGGLDALYDGLGARDFLRGRRVFVNGAAGTGVAIRRDGRLEVDLDGERRLLESGEVEFER